jgi:hypothetical protein
MSAKGFVFFSFLTPFTVARDQDSINKRHEQPRSANDGAKRWRKRNAELEKAALNRRGWSDGKS